MNNEINLDIEQAADFLKLSPSRFSELLKKRIIQQNWDEYGDIFRFNSHVSDIEAGSVLFENDGSFELIRGFPKIKRAMLLAPAIKANFSDIENVAVEEKMNGYNVRVVDYKGKLIALTRSGHVCPYSTERIQNLLEHRFFDEHPDLVVYGEMVGPDNPYVQKDVYDIDSLDFFVFDIREKKDGRPFPLHERRALVREYGFRQAEFFGEFSIAKAASNITAIIKELGKKGHEGVIIKDPNMVLQPVKYTCSESNCADLRHAFRFYNEAGRDYIFSRVIREGFQSVEWNETEEEFMARCLRLGESILRPMGRSVRQVQDGERIADDSRIRVKDEKTIDAFKSYLQRLGLDVVFSPVRKIGDEYLVDIKKINDSTSDKTLGIVQGQLWS
ncbi:RNA ligase [Methanolobus sp. ZRKC3]|uniref:RNA ligase n=1 Tax=Methanolobus sp. ZRKC3 TaxID=3125786 RepID=UPI003246CAE2